jgi:hypothetical protein
MGAWGLSCSCSGEYWVSVCCRGRPSSISRVTDWHSIEELGFQCLDRRDVTLLQGGALWSSGLLCMLGSRASGVTYRVAGYSFPPTGGESGILAI